jgi:hypothetical protein
LKTTNADSKVDAKWQILHGHHGATNFEKLAKDGREVCERRRTIMWRSTKAFEYFSDKNEKDGKSLQIFRYSEREKKKP